MLFVIDYVRLFDNSQSDNFDFLSDDYTDGRLWQQRPGDVATDGLLFVMSFDGSESRVPLQTRQCQDAKSGPSLRCCSFDYI